MTTRADQRAATRQALIAEARQLFATRGYAAVALPTLVAAAGVTKGALYHQFDSKADLFRTVLEEVQQEVAADVAAAAARHEDGWAQLLAGSEAFLTSSTAPGVQRIMFIDGPAVLGWAEWRALDEAASTRHLREALEARIADGTFPDQCVEPLTRLLSGAMNEAALWMAERDRISHDLPAVMSALERMLGGLRR